MTLFAPLQCQLIISGSHSLNTTMQSYISPALLLFWILPVVFTPLDHPTPDALPGFRTNQNILYYYHVVKSIYQFRALYSQIHHLLFPDPLPEFRLAVTSTTHHAWIMCMFKISEVTSQQKPQVRTSKSLYSTTVRFWRCCYEIRQMAFFQQVRSLLLQMKCSTAVERKNAIC